MKARGNLWASVNGSLGVVLLNMGRGEIGVSSVDSLSNKDEAGSSFFPMKVISHSLSPNFGLALVTLVLKHHGMADTLGLVTSWAFFAFLWAWASGVGVFLFCRTTHTKLSLSSSVSLRSFNLCAIKVTAGEQARVNAIDSCLLLVLCSLAKSSSSSSSSSLCDYFFYFLLLLLVINHDLLNFSWNVKAIQI